MVVTGVWTIPPVIFTLTICVDCDQIFMYIIYYIAIKYLIFNIQTIFTSYNVTNTGEEWENLLGFSDEGGETEQQASQDTGERQKEVHRWLPGRI